MQRIVVIPHDPAWSIAFAEAAEEIRHAFEGVALDIHHIGSTSIPGIHAKPVIDMLAIVDDLAAIDAKAARMEAIGYVAMGEFGIAGRRYFRRDNAAGDRTHQLHAFARSLAPIERHLAFRDYMIAHPALAEEYSQLKQRLALAHPNDINAYMDGKDPFIKAKQAEAVAWMANKIADGTAT